MNIRRATIDDIPSLSDLICRNAEKSLKAHYSPIQWNVFISYYSIEALRDKFLTQTIFCGELDKRIVGTVALEKDFVLGFYTHVDYMNQGIGSALMAHLEHHAIKHNIKKLQLAASPVGVAYYYKNGWSKVRDVVMEYNGVGFEETLMEKELG